MSVPTATQIARILGPRGMGVALAAQLAESYGADVRTLLAADAEIEDVVLVAHIAGHLAGLVLGPWCGCASSRACICYTAGWDEE